MKLLIAFCATVVVLFSPAEAGYGETGMNVLKGSLNTVSAELGSFNDGLKADLTKNLDGFSALWKQPLETALDYTVFEATKKIKDAKAQGKDVDHCFPPLEFEVENTKKNMESGLQKCIDDSVNGLEKYQKPITDHIENKKTVEAKLDKFVTDCKEKKNPIAIEACIVKSLYQATIVVGEYDTAALKLTGIESAPNPGRANDHLDVVELKNANNDAGNAQKGKLNLIANDALLSIEIKIRVAEKENKQADHCFNSSKMNLKRLSDQAFASINDCATWDQNTMSHLSKGQIISLVNNCSQGPIETLHESVKIETQIAQTCISNSKYSCSMDV